MKKFFAATVLIGSLMLAPAASATNTEHCPDHKGHPGKVEAVGDNLNDVVLDEGTVFCVKGSTDATGVLTADGETSLVDYLDNGHDVSYYVVYELPTTTTTTTAPPTTTTTAPPTTTTTQPPVTTTTVPEAPTTTTTQPEVPVTTTTEPVRTGTPVEVTPAPVTPAPVLDDELAFGGSWSALLATIGAVLASLGLFLRRLGRKN